MLAFGIILMLIGAVLLLYGGLIGIDVGLRAGRVANIGLLMVGNATFISGAVLLAGSMIVQHLQSLARKPASPKQGAGSIVPLHVDQSGDSDSELDFPYQLESKALDIVKVLEAGKWGIKRDSSKKELVITTPDKSVTFHLKNNKELIDKFDYMLSVEQK